MVPPLSLSLSLSCCVSDHTPCPAPSSCVKYVSEPDDGVLLHTALQIYRRFNQYSPALRLAMMLNDMAIVRQLFLECPDRSEVNLLSPLTLTLEWWYTGVCRLVRKQLAFMLGRQQLFLELEGDMEVEEGAEQNGDVPEGVEVVEDAEDLTEIMSNVHLNNNFLALAREVMSL